jgi:hypothetical protein
MARPYKYPCKQAQPLAVKKSACACVSTPSATTRRPRWRAIARIAWTMALSLASSGVSRTKLRSIFSSYSGIFFR